MTQAHLGDCMEAMAQMNDNEFDLAIVDPPYGRGAGTKKTGGLSTKNSMTKYKKENKEKGWDDLPPSLEYFIELIRISKNQIIFGGNYFELPKTRCFIVWDKMTYVPSMAQIELAWTSFDQHSKLIKINSNQQDRNHPTQKPVALYKWLLKNYAKEGDRILDTHLGSGSSRIAAHDMGFDFVGYEIDKDYFEAQEMRFKAHIQQQSLFTPNQMYQ